LRNAPETLGAALSRAPEAAYSTLVALRRELSIQRDQVEAARAQVRLLPSLVSLT